MKKHKKAKKVVRITVLLCVILVVYSLWGRAWPRRWFICPGEFFHLTNPNPEYGSNRFFPEKLPASAEDPRYLYYDGLFDNIWGISFILDAEEYQNMKESYLTFFREQEAERMSDAYSWYEFDEKVTMEFLEKERLEDLKHLFRGSEDSYTVLAYEILASGYPTYYIGGVICNDDTNEMIIFDIEDRIRKEKRDSER